MSIVAPYKPVSFMGKTIKFRVPYTMTGELIVAAGTPVVYFPPDTFRHNTDLPFEIWQVSLQASQSVAEDPFIPIAEPAPGIDKFWRVRIRDDSKDQLITKNPQLVATIKETNTDIWQWWVPYTIIRSEALEVAVNNLLPANALRAEITFIGYEIVLEPASETR